MASAFGRYIQDVRGLRVFVTVKDIGAPAETVPATLQGVWARRWLGASLYRTGGGLSSTKYVRPLICTPAFSYRPNPHTSGQGRRDNSTHRKRPKQRPDSSVFWSHAT